MPVNAQLFVQLRAEHDIAVLAALALADMNNHPLAINVADLQVGRFSAACSGGIEDHQQGAMKLRVCCINQTCNFFLTEHSGR